MTPSPLVSLIIVNFNGFEITKKCIKSIIKNSKTPKFQNSKYQTSNKQTIASDQTSNIPYEIIVVDNASTDDSVAKLRKVFPQKSNFRVVSRKTNDFVAAACNDGLKYSQGEIIIFMNNDLIFTRGWLERIVNAFSLKKAGIIGATILSFHKKSRIDNMGGRLNLLGYGVGIMRGETYKSSLKISKPFYIPGMFLAVRRSLFIKAGKFDESYGANYEDVDLAWRIRLLGYKVLVAKKVIIYHLGSWTVDKYLKKSRSSYLCRRNRMTTILKNAGTIHLFFALPLYFFLQLIIFLKEFILNKNIHLALTTPEAIYYNFANLKSILTKRKRIQKFRKVSDWQILKNKLF